MLLIDIDVSNNTTNADGFCPETLSDTVPPQNGREKNKTAKTIMAILSAIKTRFLTFFLLAKCSTDLRISLKEGNSFKIGFFWKYKCKYMGIPIPSK